MLCPSLPRFPFVDGTRLESAIEEGSGSSYGFFALLH